MMTSPEQKRARAWHRGVKNRRHLAALCHVQCAKADGAEMSIHRTPGTYGLTDQELRDHANDLVRQGWSVDEVRQVLAVEVAR